MENIKIRKLDELNKLDEMCGILCSFGNEFYDYYMTENIDWLLYNKDKIISDFEKDLDRYKFSILMNTRYLIKDYGYDLLEFKDIEEFNNYINFIPYKYLDKVHKLGVIAMFNQFNSIKDEYEKMQYFNSIKRK